MLGKLILILLQVAVAWIGGPIIRSYIPINGGFDLFVYAVIFAILVYLTGVLCAQVLRDIGMPSTAALSTSLIIALLAAAFLIFAPQFIPDLPGTSISNRGFVLAGAILGYLIRR